MPEKHKLAPQILQTVNVLLRRKGLMLLNHTSEFLAQFRVGSSPVDLAMLGGALPLLNNIA